MASTAAIAADAPAVAAPLTTRRVVRWLPLIAVSLATAVALLASGVAILDLLRYGAYAALAVVGPGTLVFRALRRTPHTLLEDLAYGAVTGLALELAAWALWSMAGLQGYLWTWPVVVYALFALVPGLRRHWWVRGYQPVPAGLSWTLAGVGAGFVGYLYLVFLQPTAILPTTEDAQVYIDLPFQLSLAGEAKHHFPPHVPQVAQEVLHYHWFAFAHMGSASLISGVDLPVVFYRLDIPLLCLLAIAGLGATGWRISGRASVGALAAALTFLVGEFNFDNPVSMPFGTMQTFIMWGSPSMTYSWVVLIPLVGVVGSLVTRPPAGMPGWGRAGWALAVLLIVLNSGAKASSLPVLLGALVILGAFQAVRRRFDPRVWLAAGLVLLTFGLAVVVLFAGENHGTKLFLFWGQRRFYPEGGGLAAILAIALAYTANMLLRLGGVPVLARFRRGDAQVYLFGGLLAGLGAYFVLGEPGDANQYFARAGWIFGVLASAWGWVLLADRVQLFERRRLQLVLGFLAVLFSGVLIGAQFLYAKPPEGKEPLDPLRPMLGWLATLALLGVVAVVWWRLARTVRPSLPRVGGVALLSAVLLAGVPGLAMDAAKAVDHPNGGAYVNVGIPASRTDAARWLRAHSDPSDVIATNSHCLYLWQGQYCDPRSFWLSAYSERRVLVEGYAFAPKQSALWAWSAWSVFLPFYDQKLFDLNQTAFGSPTPEVLAELHNRYGVRWLVADRAEQGAILSPQLASLVRQVYSNSRVTIYALP